MHEARIALDRDFLVGSTDPRLFGGFVEHLGRCVYGGLYEPDHPGADADGFRTDVLALVRELDMPVMRYPGGNFVSGYRWEDGVGPRADRPRRLDLAWKTVETNQFGTDEFVDWCRKAGTEPMMAVNLGTRGPEEARALVEYCNHPGGSAWSDLRRAHGHADPHGIRLWCLGNEMDGHWQMGHKTPEEYGRIAREAAKLMKWTDPAIELVVCGSCGASLPTFGTWEWEVLHQTYDLVDYLAIHTYFGKGHGEGAIGTADFLGRPERMSRFIDEVVALCDAAGARRRSEKKMQIAFDEWNVWYSSNAPDKPRPEPWSVAPPLLEDHYSMEDALVVGGMLIALLNHADRVKIGCLAQLVNVIGPILTETGGPAWRQTIFHPFAQASRHGRGTVLRQVVHSPLYDGAEDEAIPVLSSACVLAPGAEALTVFAVNRDVETPLELALDCRAFAPRAILEATTLRHDELSAKNTREAPERVRPEPLAEIRLESGGVRAVLPPASWSMLRLALAGK